MEYRGKQINDCSFPEHYGGHHLSYLNFDATFTHKNLTLLPMHCQYLFCKKGYQASQSYRYPVKKFEASSQITNKNTNHNKKDVYSTGFLLDGNYLFLTGKINKTTN